MSKTFRVVLLTFSSILVATLALAQDKPIGPVILSVSSETPQHDTEVMQFDLEMLENIGLKTIITETPWTSGPVVFEGVLLRDLIATAGATENVVSATALNDYSVRIPAEDYNAFDVLLATRRHGNILTVRDKGPIWIIYPWSDNEVLMKEVYYSRSIWQLKSITVKSD